MVSHWNGHIQYSPVAGIAPKKVLARHIDTIPPSASHHPRHHPRLLHSSHGDLLTEESNEP